MRRFGFVVLSFSLMMLVLFQVQAEKKVQMRVKKTPQTNNSFYSSERVFSDVIFKKAVAIRRSKDKQLFYILGGDRQVSVYDSQHNLLQIFSSYMQSPSSVEVDSENRIYIADSGANQIKVFSPEGKAIRTLSINQPLSFAVLSNGNIIVASPSHGWLLHLYDSSGHEIRSFGRVKQFEPADEEENNFLNRGQVLIDSTDAIYFVYRFAPTPFIQKYSSKGKEISEFLVTGKAVDLQLDVAQRFLRNRAPNKIGGITVINSATIDPGTDHIWVCMNGASDASGVYEYISNGKKLQEYSFVTDSQAYPSRAIINVDHAVISGSSIVLFTAFGTFRFDLNQSVQPRDIPFQTQATCPGAVEFNDCKTTCGTGETSDDENCKTELLATLNMTGRRIISTVCNSDSNSCTAQVTLCKESNGNQTTHNITLTCSPGGGGGGGPWVDPCIGANPNFIGYKPPEFGANVFGDCEDSPILIDMLGNGFDLTDQQHGVRFDLDSDGTAEQSAWTANGSDEAFLALDRNSNGTIDNGKELFGNYTQQSQSENPNGFIALAEFDKPANGGNSDGVIDRRDSIFTSLRLWQDANHNGISEPGELHTLASLGLARMDLDYRESRRVDQYGNQFRYRARVRDTQGAQLGRWAWDVFFVNQ